MGAREVIKDLDQRGDKVGVGGGRGREGVAQQEGSEASGVKRTAEKLFSAQT